MTTEVTVGLITLLGVLANTLVASLIGRWQYHAATVSLSRQAWINSLRNDIAEFQSLIFLIGNDENLDIVEATPLFARLNALTSQIALSLNPNEPEHVSLGFLLGDSVQAMKAGIGGDKAALVATQTSVLQSAQKIIKKEWEKIKQKK